ncbi:MAG TPA: O-unit flippase-like protein [Chthoniobacterales bacterium]|jgi:O-antigen/teichoic acid export membrane protein
MWKLPAGHAARPVFARASQSAVLWGLLATSLRLFSGVLVLPLVVRRLPSDHLGLWYVFLSLQGIAALFDLGFSPAVTRAAGYLWAGATELRRFGVAIQSSAAADTQPNYALLSGLVATMKLYYRFFGAASALVMLIGGGSWIWVKTQNLPDANTLRACYFVFVIGGFLTATGDLWPALLSGINAVRAAQKILLGSGVINLLVVTIGLLAGLKIWALVLGVIGSGLFIRLAGRKIFLDRAGPQLSRKNRPQFDLITTLWPTAWRSGLVSLGGYLVLSANTLICSAFLDLKTTASYGLSLTVIGVLNTVSATFTNIKIPFTNQLRALGQTEQIATVWIQRTRVSLLFYAMGAIFLLIVGRPAFELIGSKTMPLPNAQLAVAVLIIGLEMHHVLYAILIISENQNPFVIPALLSGVATVVLSILLTPRLGIWGMLIAQGCTQAAFNNWWTVYRGIRGLGLSVPEYWRRYIQTPFSI